MQMTVMSQGLPLNSKYIKMGREEEGFQAFLTQSLLVLFFMIFVPKTRDTQVTLTAAIAIFS